MTTRGKVEEWYATTSQDKPKTWLTNYYHPFRRVMETCMKDNNDIVKCMKDFDYVRNDIENKSQNYNTLKVYAQAVLFFIDHYPGMTEKLKDVRESYKEFWEELKLLVAENPKEYKDLPSLEDITTAVDEKYGKDSIEALFIAFYKEVPMRLDFQNIKVYGTANQVAEDQKKYVVYQSKKFIAEEYNKTSGKYGPAEYKLSNELIQKIKDSLKKQPRDELFVFSNKNPTKAITNLFTGAGLKGISMNSLRHLMSQTAETPQEKVELAKKMKHTVQASKNYRDQLGKDIETIEIPKGMKTEIEQLILDYLELHSQD